LIKLATLNRLFDGHMGGIPISCSGTCCDCGRALEIKIDKVAGGYGLQGGALHEIGNWQFMVRCEACYRTSSTPDDVGDSADTPVEVFLTNVSFFWRLSNP
jgi:hypothetical protein